jgi:hypothetical protein
MPINLYLNYTNSQQILIKVLQLLPLLTKSFTALTSLELMWLETDIPESALYTISTIASLEQIQLGAGQVDGWRHQWLICHATLVSGLKIPVLSKQT